MATFGQFMRTTMHNFRMFWSTSFGASGGPLITLAEETKASAMDGEAAEIGNNDLAAEAKTVNSHDETPAIITDVSLASGAPESVAPEPDAQEEMASEITPPALDDAVEVDAEVEPGPDADAEDATVSEDEATVQGELALEDTEGLLAPDVQIEFHGKRLGLTTLLESLLFVSDEPVDASQLARVLDISTKRVEAGLKRLNMLYENTERGLRIQVLESHYQMVTVPETANAIEDFLNLDLTTKLSGPALEALAVIAYRQPVTRAQVEAVRGVDCAGVLRSLAQRGLIEEMGRLDTVGRPILYSVTDLFMQHFGLIKLEELPPLELDDEDMLWAATKLAEMEQEQVEG